VAKRKKRAKKPRLLPGITPGVGAMENIVMDLPAIPKTQITPSPQTAPERSVLNLILIVGVGIVVLLALGAAAVFLAAQL